MNRRDTANVILGRLPDGWLGIVARADRARRRRFWRIVRHWNAFLAESQGWSEERLAAHQWEELRRLLRHANDRVPYYRNLMRELGAEPEDFHTPEDFARLPQLTKTDLQQEMQRLTAEGTEGARRYCKTSGTTGIAVGFYLDWPTSFAAEWAFITSMWRRVGYREGNRTAVLCSDLPAGSRLWMKDALDNALRMSSRHLTDEELPFYLERLRDFRPSFIKCYTSSAVLIARYMLRRGEAPIEGVKAVLCGSENLTDSQRADIERAFGCRAFGWYGQSEHVCLAGECEHDGALHIFPQYGYAELVGADGQPVSSPGVPGEIVATGFLSRSMPLIRYRTMDVAVYADGSCERCGRLYKRFARVDGRMQQFVVGASGRLISITAIDLGSAALENVRQFRFVQDTPGRLVMRVVPRGSWSRERDEPLIHADLDPRLGEDTRLERIELVDEIPALPNGKQRWLDQRLTVALPSEPQV